MSDVFKLLDNIKDNDELFHLEPDSRVLLLDGLNLFFRNFAILKKLNHNGTHIGGISGFLRSLGYLIRMIKPTKVYMVFDGLGSSQNRKNLLPEYKANRGLTRITNWEIFDTLEEEEQAKSDQITRLIDYLQCLPVHTICIDKAEADDVISYIAQKITENENSKAIIVSSDQDYLQLVKKNLIVYRPIAKDFYNRKKIYEKFSVPPDNFILYKTLMGDASDGVPGIKGLGKGKLKKLFPEIEQKVLTLDDIFAICEERLDDHIIYARVLQDFEAIKRNYKIMDLKNPMLSEQDIEYLDLMLEPDVPKLHSKEFLELYAQDGLGNTFKYPQNWLRESFEYLTTIK